MSIYRKTDIPSHLAQYFEPAELGLESTPEEYVAKMVEVFREVRRVLRDDGTLWLNIGDSYAAQRGGTHMPAQTVAGGTGGKGDKQAFRGMGGEKRGAAHRNASAIGLKHKDLIGIPWMLAFALRADGWYLRQDIIWHKPNPMPESVRDRCTKAHEYIFLLSKSERYYFDADAVHEDATTNAPHKHWTERNHDQSMLAHKQTNGAKGRPVGVAGYAAPGKRNRRSVWTVATRPYKGAHFATFPPDLIRPCILAGCPPKGKRCDCDEIIASPTGSGPIEDPTMQTGRAGMNRPRRDKEATRPITRKEQRHEAMEMKISPHRSEMERECGAAFAHYIRTDRSGARPLPHDIREKYMKAGWITPAPPCTHPIEDAGTVLDPFGGSGTTAQVAIEEGRKAILCELNADYIALAHKRLEGLQLRIA